MTASALAADDRRGLPDHQNRNGVTMPRDRRDDDVVRLRSLLERRLRDITRIRIERDDARRALAEHLAACAGKEAE